MSNNLQISYLADHPEFIDTLASWVHDHWRSILTDETIEDRTAKYKLHLNKDSLPIALVAHSNSEIFGTAALRVHDLPGREDLTPWLGGLFVAPQYRRQGIGKSLCLAIEKKAKYLFRKHTLYLFTLDKQEWYNGLGWNKLEPCTWCGRAGDIMIKELFID